MVHSYALRPSWTPLTIALMVIGFMIFWPLGLIMLAYILWGERVPEIRRHFAGMLAPVVTIDRNSLEPSTVSAACCSKKSKKLVSRGKNRPNMQAPARACNTAATMASRTCGRSRADPA